jgi:hydrogenase nickel incorporation protein HypB
MCTDCGCGDEAGVRVTVIGAGPDHAHAHHSDAEHDHTGHDHHHHDHADHDHADHDHAGHAHVRGGQQPGGRQPAPPGRQGKVVTVEEAVLAKNDRLAARNRAWLAGRDITAVNLMSSPGSGKTSVLERTIRELTGERNVAVIEGDQETALDADRIRATGCRVVQINTGAGCHLDADMLARGLDALAPAPSSLLFIENVGNLVCPALFDLGETGKAVVISVTEGDDKPLKYPHMFAAADVVLVNKVDLLPYVDFDVRRCAERARTVNPRLAVLPVSAKTGEGIDRWYEWLQAR